MGKCLKTEGVCQNLTYALRWSLDFDESSFNIQWIPACAREDKR